MEKILVCYQLLLKASLKKRDTWVLLAAMLVLLIVVKGIQLPSVENVTAGVYTGGDVYAEKLMEELAEVNVTSKFVGYDDSEELQADVEAGVLECGFICTDDFGEKILSGNKKDTIKYFATPYTTKGETIKETFYAVFFRLYSEEILRGVESEVFFETDEQRMAEILAKNEEYTGSDSVFHIEMLTVDTKQPEQANQRNPVLPIQGLVGLFILTGMFLATGRKFESGRQGIMRSLAQTGRFRFQVIDEIAAVTPLAIVGVVAIVMDAGSRGLLEEILRMMVFLLWCGLWNGMITLTIRRDEVLMACVTALVAAHLVVCPIVFDVTAYVPAVRFLRYLTPLGIYL